MCEQALLVLLTLILHKTKQHPIFKIDTCRSARVSPPAPLRKDFSRQFDWWVLFLHQVQWIKKKRKKRKTQIPFQSLTAQRSESVFKKSSGSEVCRAFSQEKETNSPSLLQNFDDLDLRFIPWLSLCRQAVCLRSRTVWLRPLMHFDDS